ncbi:Transcription factor TGA1 [Striga hermonthica]|uniref:Transcription factor TGA1 n=1 Tax=Striga hermonthica TaxID=68872 RepID=A0A9N7RI93_STRHE|nr:Transcription factor TGA1 [Striga hermonthica]
MNSTSTQFVPARRMGIYEPIHQMGMWSDFKGKTYLDESSVQLILDIDAKHDNQSEDTSHGTVGPFNKYDQEASKPDKVLRRLAQNREAARKSRLRKKAYVQQLENSKLRLFQLEQELQQAKKQGLYIGGTLDATELGCVGTTNPAIATFEVEYGQWVEELNRQISGLGKALQSNVGDLELRSLVDGGMKHYFDLFVMKSTAAKADVFYVMSGLWKTPTERFFLWVGGFRPSEILRLEALVRFVAQADHLRQETLQQLLRILTPRQAARAFITLVVAVGLSDGFGCVEWEAVCSRLAADGLGSHRGVSGRW